MEPIGGGAAARFSRRRREKPPERYIGVPQPQSPAAAPPVELSEQDIFATPSGCSSPPPAQQNSNLNAAVAARSINRNHYGILAALNGSFKSSSGSEHEVRPVFNHKASIAASLSSSSISASPASPLSSRLMIPRPPPLREDLGRVHHQSVPVNIPAMPHSLRMKATEADDAVSEGEDDDDDDDGVRLPPHELVDSRHSPMLSCSVLEGAGRTLKGRDLRQVRNAIWRRTGFVD